MRSLLALLAGLSVAVALGAACDSVNTVQPTPTPGGSPTPTNSTPPTGSPTPSGTPGTAQLQIRAKCTLAVCSSPVTGNLVSILEDCNSHAVMARTSAAGITMTTATVATNNFYGAGGGFACVDTFFDVNTDGVPNTGDLTAFIEVAIDPVAPAGLSTAGVLFSQHHS